MEANQKEDAKIKIEISSYRSLLEILGKTKNVIKIVIALLILVFTIFIGLAFVTISIKRIYPYNDIKTNAFGATTMQNEDVELTYWLFSTAEMWANSGVSVEAGDILTIRASGRSHTAIHHLVAEVSANKKLVEEWSATDGRNRGNDGYRMSYRLFRDKPQDALLMQVIPENVDFSDVGEASICRKFMTYNFIDEESTLDKAWLDTHRENFYCIGKERVDMKINHSGILHFCVNDIVLTHRVIDSMQAENNRLICNKIADSIPALAADLRRALKQHSLTADQEKLWGQYNLLFFKLGAYPDKAGTRKSNKNELTYYKETNYWNAWLDDNVGSFLIVIERRKNK
ncbi:MAG: hypothetical protein RR330_02010 [Alistipes sp.]